MDKISATDKVEAATKYNTMPADSMGIGGYYTATCHGADGQLKWTDVIENLVVTVGRNFTLDTTLGNVAGGAVVMGLKGTGTAVAADTQASHASWLEVGLANAPTYAGNRPTPSFSAASAGSKATSSAVSFSITSTGTVAGCFINIGGSATKDNTTGTLFSAGDFSSSKSVVSGDTIAVTYTASLTAT
tara:strand:+ start:3163 stop:3726 length:564 start_codon:yes stop_codon:yes gene_type:complete